MPENPRTSSGFSAKSFCKGKFPHFALRENLYSRICNSTSDDTKFHIVHYVWIIWIVNEVALAYYIKFWNLWMFLYWSPLVFFLCLSSRTRKSRKWPEKSRSRLRSLMQHRYEELKRTVKLVDYSRNRKTFGLFVSFGLANLTKRLAILGRKAVHHFRNEKGTAVADPGEGALPPLFLEQTETRRGEKNFFETPPRPLSLSEGLNPPLNWSRNASRNWFWDRYCRRAAGQFFPCPQKQSQRCLRRLTRPSFRR